MQVTRVAPDWPVPSLMHRRRVMKDRITYVGLDVHKEGIVVAVAEDGVHGEAREYSRIANTPAALARLAGKVGRDAVKLRFCFKAGPWAMACIAVRRGAGTNASWRRRRSSQSDRATG
jgi:hypothetical protein